MATAPSSSLPPKVVHSSISSLPAEPIIVPSPRTGPITGPELGTLFRKFKRLQNGSDIRGIAMDGVPSEPVTLTPGAAFFIGAAFAQWLAARSQPGAPVRIAIGRDPRLSGPALEAALVAGATSAAGGAAGVDLFGPATTPCMFYACIHKPGEYQGGIMVTASHMPWNANGFKFFTSGGGLEKADIADLLQRATAAAAAAGVMLGDPWLELAHVIGAAAGTAPAAPRPTPLPVVRHRDFRPAYAAFLRSVIVAGVGAAPRDGPPSLPLLGTKIVVDAGNGAGGFFATEVLAPLGADVSGSRFLDGDGSFPNHVPNPEHPSAMASGAQAVLQAGADLGIVFDTDVDRSAIVDRHGREINSNRFIALMSAIVLREHPGTTVVTDSVTSNGLTAFIEALGGQHLRYRRGYKNVIGKGIQLNKEGVETHLMMETSGHGAIKENHFLDDGAYLAVKVVIEAVRRKLSGQQDVSELVAQLPEPLESREFRIRIADPEFGKVGATVLQRFHAWVTASPGTSGSAPPNWKLEPVNHEGWRVVVEEGEGKAGWALLRQSLHDPLLVLNVESEVEGGAQVTAGYVLDFLLTQCQGLPLDLATLRLA